MYSRKKNIPGKQLNELGLFVKILYPKEKNNVKIVNRARILRLSFCIITPLNEGPGEQKMALSNTNQSLIPFCYLTVQTRGLPASNVGFSSRVTG